MIQSHLQHRTAIKNPSYESCLAQGSCHICLNITEKPTLSTILPLILEPSPIKQNSILDYNEKLSRRDSPQKCRVYSTFHRIPSTPKVKAKMSTVQLSSIYEDLTCIASGKGDREKYFNVSISYRLRQVNSLRQSFWLRQLLMANYDTVSQFLLITYNNY